MRSLRIKSRYHTLRHLSLQRIFRTPTNALLFHVTIMELLHLLRVRHCCRGTWNKQTYLLRRYITHIWSKNGIVSMSQSVVGPMDKVLQGQMSQSVIPAFTKSLRQIKKMFDTLTLSIVKSSGVKYNICKTYLNMLTYNVL